MGRGGDGNDDRMEVGVQEVAAALIGALAIVVAGALPLFVSARRTKQRQATIIDAVGEKNGSGSMIEMQERTLRLVSETLGWQQRHDERDEMRFKAVTDRLDKLED